MRLYISTQTHSLWSLGGRHEADAFGTGVVHACMEMMDRGGEGMLEVHPSGTPALVQLSRDADILTHQNDVHYIHMLMQC